MIQNMPEGWRVKKLSECGKIITGKTPSKIVKEYWNSNDVSFVKPDDFTKDTIIEFDIGKDFISFEGFKKAPKIPPYSVLTTCIGNIGKVLINKYEISTNQQINSIVPNQDIHYKYLAYSILKLKPIMIQKANAPVVPMINKTDFGKYEVLIPPLQQQEKIVRVLDLSSALIEKQRELLQKYDLFLKSKFIEMFGDPINNIHNWDMINLGEVVKIDAPMVEPNAPEYQDMFHIGPDRIEKHTGKLLPALKVKEENLISKKFLFNEEYILYSKIRPNLNKVAVVNFSGLCSADMYPIKPISEKLSKLFLWRLLLSKFFLRYTESLSDRANIPKLNRKELAKFSFPLPPITLQNKFAQIVEKVEQIKNKESAKLQHLQTLHASLMDKAFKGEIG